MVTAFFTDTRFAQHTMPGHPEHAGRLQAVVKLLEAEGVLSELKVLTATPATVEPLLAIHEAPYLDLLASTAKLTRATGLGLDTYIVPQSYELARLAAGGVMEVITAVLKEEAQNGIAAVRPPGHHATPSQGMGFCLLNNIAIGARYAQQVHGLERVAIVDFDVHHGNGTQDAFYGDPSVLFISSHQSPLYPGTGSLPERGKGQGLGYTVNLPLPPNTGDAAIQQVYTEVVAPVLRRFQPQLILVSAGFDAHHVDPLAQLKLSLLGFNSLVRLLLELAQELCQGKLVFVMEGGYDLTALSYGWLNIANALLGKNSVSDPLGSAQQPRPLTEHLLEEFKKANQLV